jgi:hypothetical protein
MYGDAPIVNSATAAAPATSEDGLLPYGGTATHNGGTLKYVRVEYAGHHSNKDEMDFLSTQ